MLKGSLYLITEPRMEFLDNNTKVIILSEDRVDGIFDTIGIRGSILLPPYEASMYRCENRMQEFYNSYLNHIYSKEALQFLSAMFRALYNGTNLLIYSKPDELETYFQAFSNILMYEFGIIIGTPTNPFTYNDSFNAKLLSLMYSFDLMNYDEIMLAYPLGEPFSQSAVYKMMYDTGLNGSIQELSAQFFAIKENIQRRRMNGGMSPFARIK